MMKRKVNVICMICLLSIGCCLATITVCASDIYISKYLRYTVEDNSVTIVGYNGSESEVTIPSQIAGNPVNVIAEGAFADCESVRQVNLPDTIMTIEEGAFAHGQTVVHDKQSETGKEALDESLVQDKSCGQQKPDQQIQQQTQQGEQQNEKPEADTNMEQTGNIVNGDVDEGEFNMQEEKQPMREQNNESQIKPYLYYVFIAILAIIVLVVILLKKYKDRDKGEA